MTAAAEAHIALRYHGHVGRRPLREFPQKFRLHQLSIQELLETCIRARRI